MRPEAPPLVFSPRPPSVKLSHTTIRRPVRQVFSHLAAALALALTVGCMPPTPAQKATDAARELNMAARWGRMSEALSRTDPKEQADFTKRHAGWHGNLRIVETEIVGLNMIDATHASVQVDVSWMFSDDPTLRVTRLKQEWNDENKKWRMISEEKIGGDPGLFGEEVDKADKKKDKHFPSRVIH
jgi:hypothetical protein